MILIMIGSSQDLWTHGPMVDYSHITPEAGMVMKKAYGDDSPLQQGARKSFWPSRSRVDDGGGLQYVSWKSDRSLRVFPTKRIYRRKGDVKGWTRAPHHLVARPGGGPRHPMVRLPPGCSPSLLWTPSSCELNRNFSFCFVQFQEYFLCNFSETQKQ
jgi:hypothetical protein